MKRFIRCIALLALVASLRAASPEEEAHFLNAIRDAYTKKYKEAVLALSCLDRVPDRLKKMNDTMFADPLFDKPIKSVHYQAVDSDAAKTYQQGGVTYGPNLPVTKEIAVEYEEAEGSRRLIIFVGEKDGKLLISKLAPLP